PERAANVGAFAETLLVEIDPGKMEARTTAIGAVGFRPFGEHGRGLFAPVSLEQSLREGDLDARLERALGARKRSTIEALRLVPEAEFLICLPDQPLAIGAQERLVLGAPEIADQLADFARTGTGLLAGG